VLENITNALEKKEFNKVFALNVARRKSERDIFVNPVLKKDGRPTCFIERKRI